MNEKNLKKTKKQDVATQRILAVFVMAAVVLWAMSKLYGIMTTSKTFMLGQIVNTVLLVVGGIAAVVFIMLSIRERKQGSVCETQILSNSFFALCSMVICVSSFILAVDFYYGMHILYVFLPVVAVLYLVYYVFERQFFSYCVASAMSISAAYWCYSGVWERIPALLIAGILCLVPVVLTFVNSGSLQKVSEIFLGKQYDKRYTVLVYAVMLLLLAVAAVLQGKVALIISLCMGAYLLAAAVYYTIKAM